MENARKMKLNYLFDTSPIIYLDVMLEHLEKTKAFYREDVYLNQKAFLKMIIKHNGNQIKQSHYKTLFDIHMKDNKEIEKLLKKNNKL